MSMRSLLLLSLLAAACGGDPAVGGDGAVTLGMRALPGYRIDAAAEVTLSQAGFGVSSVAVGHYRLLWTGDTSDVFEGSVTTDGVFNIDETSPLGGKELIANEAGLISFRLNPTAQVNGLDLVTSAGPIYLDLTRNAGHAAASIVFVRDGQQQLSAHNPVAIDLR